MSFDTRGAQPASKQAVPERGHSAKPRKLYTTRHGVLTLRAMPNGLGGAGPGGTPTAETLL
jgi:hypothetical protein